MVKRTITFAAFLLMVSAASAFSLKDVVNSDNVATAVTTAVTAATGGTTVSASTLTGTWAYSAPAVKLESDNALTEAAGSLATSTIESKLSSAYTKAGITSGKFSFTFSEDLTFSCTTGSKTLSGQYAINEDGTIKLTFKAVGTINLGSVDVEAEISTSSLKLLFNADKLLEIVSSVSTSSSNTSLQTLNTFLSKYDGVLIGFELTK